MSETNELDVEIIYSNESLPLICRNKIPERLANFFEENLWRQIQRLRSGESAAVEQAWRDERERCAKIAHNWHGYDGGDIAIRIKKEIEEGA